MSIYIHKNEQQLGPFDESQILEGLKNGEFKIDDLAWKEGLSEWVSLEDLIQSKQNNDSTPSIPIIRQKEKPLIIQTNIKQGAVIGGWVCFALGMISMYFSIWTFFIYAPLFLVAFILSIVAMAQKRVAGGIALLLVTIILPSLVGLFLFTTRTTKAVAKVLGVEEARPSNPQKPKNDELDKKNGFRNLILGTQYSEISNLLQIDNGFFTNVFKSKDDESKQYILKEKGGNIGDAEIREIKVIFNQDILTKISVDVIGKQNVLILKESLIKAYGQPFSESNRIITWCGENNKLDLIIDDKSGWATAEFTNKKIDKEVDEIIKNKKIKEEEDMKKKAKESSDQGAKSL